ncbi:MAG: PEGA domain-containing protein [Rhodothermales bacterium]
MPIPPRNEVGFFRAYGPLFYFALLVSIPVLGALLLLTSTSDPAFVPLSDDERASLMSGAPAPTASLAPAALEVRSEPGDALVYVDGAFEGITPYRTETMASGWHALVLRKQGYAIGDTLVYVQAGEATSLAFALAPLAVATPTNTAPTDTAPSDAERMPETEPDPLTGTAQIDTAPAGAEVYVDGALAGRSPLQLRDLEPGAHDVTLALAGHASHTLRVVVAPGGHATARADLVPLTGTLRVVVRPWGSVYVDGVLHARDSDLRHDLVVPVGSHLVRAVHPVLGTQEWRVEVEADGHTDVEFDLN